MCHSERSEAFYWRNKNFFTLFRMTHVQYQSKIEVLIQRKLCYYIHMM